jgi:hypothetical protein
MKSGVIAMAGVVALAASWVHAAPRLAPVLGQPVSSEVVPVPDQPGVVTPSPDPAVSGPVVSGPVIGGPVIDGAPIAMYGNVRYKDRKNIHPCAVPTIVQVPDPCNPACCVGVEVCLPPGEPCVTTARGGRKVKYDYGKYGVEIVARGRRLIVDYDD